jgi:histidine ammonia-lyase
MNEIAESYDDLMSEPLNAARRHEGQQVIAAMMRDIAKDSHRLPKREHALYNGGHTEQVFAKKVQAYYSLRCIPQILGPVWETLQNAKRILEEEFNAASDNPIVDYEVGNVFHGGNFHGDYISLEEDKVKIAVTRMVMTAERQLNYLFHDRINDGIMPPFLNRGVLGLNYGMQACQFTATSTTAECQTLSMPNYVHSIPNNNDNQDIVSMGTNSALLCRQVIENAYQVFAIHLMALAQATDILAIQDQIASSTKALYDELRTLTDSRIEDKPFYEDITRIVEFLKHKI